MPSIERNLTAPALLWDLARSFVSHAKEIRALHAALKGCVDAQWISGFEIVEDAFNPDYPRPDVRLFRFVVRLKGLVEQNIATNGISLVREIALRKALGEALERIAFFKRSEFPWLCHDVARGSSFFETPTCNTTNGFALHRCFSLAFAASVEETVERHSLLLHWYTKTRALGRIVLSNRATDPVLAGIVSFQDFCASNDINFAVLQLHRVESWNAVMLLARTRNPKLPFHALIATAAGFDLRTSLAKAYGEMLKSYGGAPKDKREKTYHSASDVEDLPDHQLYYQDLERLVAFDFLVGKEDLPSLDLPPQQTFALLRRFSSLVQLAKNNDLKIYEAQLPSWFQDFHVVKTASPGLLELNFGQQHGEMDRSILEDFSQHIDLSEPHPLN